MTLRTPPRPPTPVLFIRLATEHVPDVWRRYLPGLERARRSGGVAETSSSRHRAIDRLLLLGRERDRRAPAVEVLDVDPRVVAPLDRRDDRARCAWRRAARPTPTAGPPVPS